MCFIFYYYVFLTVLLACAECSGAGESYSRRGHSASGPCTRSGRPSVCRVANPRRVSTQCRQTTPRLPRQWH